MLVFSASSQIMIISPILPLIGEQLSIDESLLGTLVSAYALMVGVPAKRIGWVCRCGEKLEPADGRAACKACGDRYALANERLTPPP